MLQSGPQRHGDMASLTSNPMEEMMEEEEYQASDTNKNISGAGGYRRSWSNPGPEPDSNRPNTLRLCSGNSVLFFVSPQVVRRLR